MCCIAKAVEVFPGGGETRYFRVTDDGKARVIEAGTHKISGKVDSDENGRQAVPKVRHTVRSGCQTQWPSSELVEIFVEGNRESYPVRV